MWCFQRIRRALSPALALWAWPGAAGEALAHPHVWVTVETEIVYDQQKAITGFRHKWTFDEYYSQFAVMGLDKNNDGKLDRDELQELAQVNIDALKEFDYFTFPKVDGKLLGREPPQDYWLTYEGNKLTLFLTLPLKTPLPADKTKTFTFTVYDPTYYVDFAFAPENPVRLSNAPPGCLPAVKEPAPQSGQRTVSSLSESALNNLTSANSDADQYAKFVVITCPAS